MQKQKGFLIVTAVVIVVILGLLSAALVSVFVRSTEATVRLQAIPKADALAESGLEQARRNFSITDFTSRQTCTSLASTASLSTGNSITSRATNVANNPRYAFTTLTSALTSVSTPTTLSVANANVFSPDGWVLIGREVFQYTRIADATTLAGVTRAQDNSLASNHPSNSIVSQYQCYVAGIGHAPATNPMSIREYQQGMRSAVLFAAGQNGTILRWNGETAELAWASQASGTTLDLFSVSALNYHSAWASASQSASGFNFSRLQGNAPWTSIAVGLGSETNLPGIDAPSSYEAWAVGKRQGSNTTILRWVRNATNSNTNWCNASASSCPGISVNEASVKNSQKDLYAIKTYDLNGDGYADTGFAAGGSHDESGKEGVILYYSAPQWSSITKAPLNFTLPANVSRLIGLDITRNGSATPKEAFFAGEHSVSGGLLLRLRIVSGSANWILVNPTQTLNAVSVIDTNGDGLADFGCAVGNNGTVITFNSAMSTSTITLAGSPKLNAVLVISPTDVWTVGDGGVSFHYNGISWTSIATPTTNNLNALSGIFPQQTMLSTWHELIN